MLFNGGCTELDPGQLALLVARALSVPSGNVGDAVCMSSESRGHFCKMFEQLGKCSLLFPLEFLEVAAAHLASDSIGLNHFRSYTSRPASLHTK